ncbi:MAG TPA: alpha/beta fold hydrolase [Chthonomonadaceae bacterium]|nr:alpha/beta fold hydrolase [Chthonomonadaceae bacterium]
MSRLWRAALLAGVAFAVPAAINRAIARQKGKLLKALPGESGIYPWPMGDIYYEVRGEGPPLVLVHGIGAGNSSYEWRHNLDPLSDHFRVFVLDLPGFGKSARPNINYTDDLMILALTDFLRDVVRQPAALLASSLSGAYAVKLAAAHPEEIEKLVLVCPTGLRQLRLRTPVWSQMVYGTFSLPVLGLSLYNAMLSYNRMDEYLRRNLYADPTLVTPALVEHFYVSAHQPGAQYAFRSFLADLLNCDITPDYPKITQPILIAWGARAHMTPVENAKRFLEMNANARLRVFENSGLLPHDEEAEIFNAETLAFLTGQERAQLPEAIGPIHPIEAQSP